MQESRVDMVLEISEREADETMRALAKVEGIFSGIISHMLQDLACTINYQEDFFKAAGHKINCTRHRINLHV